MKTKVLSMEEKAFKADKRRKILINLWCTNKQTLNRSDKKKTTVDGRNMLHYIWC